MAKKKEAALKPKQTEDAKISDQVAGKSDKKAPIPRKTRTVRALKNTAGCYGATKWDLTKGKKYKFNAEIADMLIKSGRCI